MFLGTIRTGKNKEKQLRYAKNELSLAPGGQRLIMLRQTASNCWSRVYQCDKESDALGPSKQGRVITYLGNFLLARNTVCNYRKNGLGTFTY
jgi:hypothetical protein